MDRTRGRTVEQVLAAPWGRPADEVLEVLGSDPDQGLSTPEVARRQAEHGPNVLRDRGGRSLLDVVGAQLRDSLILVLLGAAVLTVLSADYHDTVIILFVVAANTALGTVQDRRAERAVAALAALTAPTAQVVRDGAHHEVAATALVPGDVVLVEAGAVVPADGRLLEAAHLEADEAAFTGESLPVAKGVEAVETGSPVADRSSMLHAGTVVSRGRARFVVTSTAMRTEVGQLAQLLTEGSAPKTPLQRRLGRLSRQLALGVGAVCLLVVALGLARGLPTELVLVTGISLAVAAVPESLPAVVTLSLALAAQRMARRGALVRRLPAVEALGSVTVIASDKTGTLTDGVMTARRVWTPSGEREVTGRGYGPDGTVVDADDEARGLLEAAVLCNDARLVQDEGRWSVLGDPTEGALLAAAAKAQVDADGVRAAWQRVREEPFDASRARMTTVHRDGAGAVLVVCKGAPEVVLRLHGGAAAEAAADVAHRWAEQGLRVLAVAVGRPAVVPRLEDVEEGLELLGLVALQDPPRADAVDAVASCRTAGIVPLMITGDHPATARAVADALQIADDAPVVTGRELLDGREPDLRTRVYARTAPEQKLAIVRTWQDAGHVVAMTGDGVNDAPALQRADVGVAMGRGGTDVARQSADLVLSDDSFATIVQAVEEGRRVYDNIRRFLLYGLAGGVAEVLVMLGGPAVGLALPLLPGQILWMNLLTHGLPGVAMGAEQAEHDIMRRPPRDPEEGVLGGGLAQACLALSVVLSITALLVSQLVTHDDAHARTVVFLTLTMQQLLVALVLRSTRRPAWATGVRGNPLLLGALALNVVLLLASVYVPGVNALLDTEPVPVATLGWCLLAALAAPLAVEGAKAVARLRQDAGVDEEG